MIERPSKGRAIINQGFNSMSIQIPAKKNWFVIIFASVWMCGWLMGETFAIGMLFFSETPFFANVFFFVWLTLWTIGGAVVLYSILWQLIGKETINIDRGILEVKKSVKGIGRKKSYDIKSIKNIDINPTQDLGMWGARYNYRYGVKSGKIKFDYGMETINFANDIDEAEAKMIIEKLKGNSNLKEENFA